MTPRQLTETENKMWDHIANFFHEYDLKQRILEASDSPVAARVQTDGKPNTRRCKCAYCGAALETGTGHPHNGFNGKRYLCDECWGQDITRAYDTVIEYSDAKIRCLPLDAVQPVEA